MRTIDQLFGWLLVIGALLHAGGSWSAQRDQPAVLVWALSGSLAALLVAAVNLLRAGRPSDRPVALIALFGALGWLLISLGFGKVIGNELDFRVIWHGSCAFVLAMFSLRSAMVIRAS